MRPHDYHCPACDEPHGDLGEHGDEPSERLCEDCAITPAECPHCGEDSDVRVTRDGIPYDVHCHHCADDGEPLIERGVAVSMLDAIHAWNENAIDWAASLRETLCERRAGL